MSIYYPHWHFDWAFFIFVIAAIDSFCFSFLSSPTRIMTYQDKEISTSEIPCNVKDEENKSSNHQDEKTPIIVAKDELQEGIVEQGKITQTTQGIQVTIEHESPEKPAEEKDYSSFTTWEKRFIVFTATIGAFFSPFTAQIYFPALNTLAKDLHVSSSKINLTMTTYMVGFSFPYSNHSANTHPDPASNGTRVYRRLLRQCRTKTSLHDLLHNLHRSRHRPRPPKQLRRPSHPPHGPIRRQQRYCRPCQRRRSRRRHLRRTRPLHRHHLPNQHPRSLSRPHPRRHYLPIRRLEMDIRIPRHPGRYILHPPPPLLPRNRPQHRWRRDHSTSKMEPLIHEPR